MAVTRETLPEFQLTDVADENWDVFVDESPHGHFLQTSVWRDLKCKFGWQGRRVALAERSGRIVGGAQALLRRVGPFALAYVPKGPVVDWHDAPTVQALMRALARVCGEEGAVALKIEPDLPDTPRFRRLLFELGFRPSNHTVQPRSTIVLDIGGDEEMILQRMKSKWRYNVRLAARKGVTVRTLEPDELPIFHALMAATGSRDGFAVHEPAYYDEAYALMTPRHGVFLLAEYESRPLGAMVVAEASGVASYLWGASNNEERSRMPNHALQWAAIQWARSRGARRYDFWGIPDDVGKIAAGLRNGDGSGVAADELPLDLDLLPDDGLWGVYRFKQGFGGHVFRSVGTWDYPLYPLGYRVYQIGIELQRNQAELRRLGPTAWLAKAGRQVRRAQRGKAETACLECPVRVTEATQWRAVLDQLPDPHVLQSWEWGEIKAQTGWKAERLALPGADGRSVAAFQFLWRQALPLIPLRVAYVPKGPVVDWTDAAAVERVLDAVEQEARRRFCLFVKIDPDVEETSPAGRRLLDLLRRRRWRLSREQIQLKNTAYTDLSVGEDALLDAMKSKWRYNIRLAERRGITVRQGAEADLAAFYTLYAETGNRDGFLIRPSHYYETTWRAFLRAEAEADNPAGGALLLAEHPEETQPLAGLILLRYGRRAWYFYGASSDRRRRDMPNYLLQWEAMRWCASHGCVLYDWWGAPDELADADDRLQGVWQFKQGFGACFAAHVGAWDYPLAPWLYTLYGGVMPRALSLLRRLRDGDREATAAIGETG
jgi:lipid II:glycine glycyltransferase (peptidoglycan interpeptide bridge formation enzyme)